MFSSSCCRSPEPSTHCQWPGCSTVCSLLELTDGPGALSTEAWPVCCSAWHRLLISGEVGEGAHLKVFKEAENILEGLHQAGAGKQCRTGSSAPQSLHLGGLTGAPGHLDFTQAPLERAEGRGSPLCPPRGHLRRVL